jgi:hypothetical protein
MSKLKLSDLLSTMYLTSCIAAELLSSPGPTFAVKLAEKFYKDLAALG